ncbi:glutathione S-transferase C-terminal domain-containing protein [Pseudomonas sp. CCC3.1]|uniref:glutathione S-transferase C-terminal domain-containing protein n=1 Tax=Pseudomonas sp. CCC3.1 TaxID=3048607 RepID=UPI002AC95CF7|nr:glutathione S-transferase C-terminal domain-containing protein [Pseudomonas sp. CCC3.1]MEB0206071.1 glutathione binding-like protein [Pseudomonas sp. CCC3.1]WPX36737.1 glutathione binding-like protein [Pseudomonas sp. CCC3.1]
MTTLFISPGACSFAAHVVIHELQLPITVERATIHTPDTPYRQINPSGRVPALLLDDKTLVTENTAILPYLADLRPGTSLFAAAGTTERALIQSWIGYLGTEVHVGAFRPINRPERYSTDEAAFPGIRQRGLQQLANALKPLEARLRDESYLVGNRFTLADAYLGVFVGWSARAGSLLRDFPALQGFLERYLARESVVQTRAAEGLA